LAQMHTDSIQFGTKLQTQSAESERKLVCPFVWPERISTPALYN
jgi:hypothetical protein